MPRKRLKYVHRFVTQHGEVNWYYRRGHIGRIRLPDDYGSPEFMTAYAIASRGGLPDVRRYETYDRRKARTEEILSRLLSGCRWRARRQDWEFDLTLDWLTSLAKRQNFCCAITGIAFELKVSSGRERGQRNPYAPSIDRIDSTGGYTKGNVRLVAFAVNIMLADWGEAVLARVAECYGTNLKRSMCQPQGIGVPTTRKDQ